MICSASILPSPLSSNPVSIVPKYSQNRTTKTKSVRLTTCFLTKVFRHEPLDPEQMLQVAFAAAGMPPSQAAAPLYANSFIETPWLGPETFAHTPNMGDAPV